MSVRYVLESSDCGLLVADIVIHGATPSGIMAATASCEGVRVVVVEPFHHVGGLVSGGISVTDT